jgi:hypothetical protein
MLPSPVLKLFKKIRQYLTIIVLIFGLIFGLILLPSKPSSSQSITGINSEISNLRLRINRLESTIRMQPTNSNSAPGMPYTIPQRGTNSNTTNNPPIVNDRAIGRSDPTFERLATLLIELKEDVRNLETRVNILEGDNRG